MAEPERERDPFLAELIDEVLGDHADLPPEVLEEMRWVLELAATTHPMALGIVSRARPSKEPLRSGEQDTPAAAERAAKDGDDGRAAGGGRRGGANG
jgi:hypothetical protein